MKRIRSQQAARPLRLVVLACVAAAACFAAFGAQAHEVTAVARVDVADVANTSEIWLGRLTAEPASSAPPVVGLRWLKDTSGWFPTWVLELVSSAGVLPETTAVKQYAGIQAVQLAKEAPKAGRTYEVTLAYAAAEGVIAVRVVDTADGRVVFADGFTVPAYDGPVHAPEADAVPYYLPIGVTWNPGAVEDIFLPLTRFDRRSGEAAIRLLSPTPVPGEFRFTVRSGDDERLLAVVSPAERVTQVPLRLSDLPLGVSELRMDYVAGGEVLLSEVKEITVGRADVRVRPIVPEHDRGTVTAYVDISTPEPLSEPLAVSVRATVSELVWDEGRRAFDPLPYAEDLTVYEGTVDLSSGQVRLTLTVPLPDRPGNWQLRFAPEVRPEIAVSLSGGERLFSTHRPAEVAEGEPYTIVVLPDTQHYAREYPHIYTRMTGWIAANAASMNLAAVLHVGDITHNNVAAQWENAYASMSLLHGVVPYVIAIGNHDMIGPAGGVTRRGDTLVNQFFTVEEARKYGNLAGTLVPGRIENHYALLSIGGTDYLVLSLEFAPPDEAVEWARAVAAQYPDHKLILLTHSYLSGSGNRSSNALSSDLAKNPETTVNAAASLWNRILWPHPNSFLVVGGHSAPKAPTVPYQVHLNSGGNFVFEFVFDWQDEADGGNGWLGLITINPDGTMDVGVYSPYLGQWAEAVDPNGFTSRLTAELATGRVRRYYPN